MRITTWAVVKNSYAPIPLRLLRDKISPYGDLSVIFYMGGVWARGGWGFRGNGGFSFLLNSLPIKCGVYAKRPSAYESDKAMRRLANSLYGLVASCKEWYIAIIDILSRDFGEKRRRNIRQSSSGQNYVPTIISENVREGVEVIIANALLRLMGILGRERKEIPHALLRYM